jgi:hypothetical protein
MKAVTLTQPWASLVALKKKRVETRSWYTAYRGELVIHAAKGFPKWAQECCYELPFLTALDHKMPLELPRSVGLCIVRLVACVKTTELHKLKAIGFSLDVSEIRFGNFDPGRFAWALEYVRPIDPPIHAQGSLGLWNWPEVIL